ncbi:hypothetical protein SDC9_177149 [bioreactor metagenome]|uniref:Uncharacterized protein n=1 Tax=bioreactor metagenome TaxID=1076179 RepID=A0A645GTX4_9ZZZZ
MAVQLSRVLPHAQHQTADIIRLLSIGRVGVKRVLPRKGFKALRRQPPVQQLLRRHIRKAQLIGQMDGDFPCNVPYHNPFRPLSFSVQRHAVHMNVHRAHRAAGHGLHRGDDGLLRVLRHLGDGVSV